MAANAVTKCNAMCAWGAPSSECHSAPLHCGVGHRHPVDNKRGKDRTMKQSLVVAALCGALFAHGAVAGNGTPINAGSAEAITLAVYGDWPYSQALLAAAPLLIDSINADPKVRLVLHVGDIHSGSMP